MPRLRKRRTLHENDEEDEALDFTNEEHDVITKTSPDKKKAKTNKKGTNSAKEVTSEAKLVSEASNEKLKANEDIEEIKQDESELKDAHSFEEKSIHTNERKTNSALTVNDVTLTVEVCSNGALITDDDTKRGYYRYAITCEQMLKYLIVDKKLHKRWKLQNGKKYELWNCQVQDDCVVGVRNSTCRLAETATQIIIDELSDLSDPDVVKRIEALRDTDQIAQITLKLIVAEREIEEAKPPLAISRGMITGYDRSGKIRIQKWIPGKWMANSVGKVYKFKNLNFGTSKMSDAKHVPSYILTFGANSKAEPCDDPDLNDYAATYKPEVVVEHIGHVNYELSR